MRIPEFRLERYFAKHEFSAPYLMCCSDCEALNVGELFAMDPEGESRLRQLHLGYTETQGNSKLRDEIAKLYYQVGPAQVLVYAGAEEAIFNVMNCVLQVGDHVIVQSPTYQSLFEVANSLGAQVSKWQADEENDWKLDFGFLEKNVQNNTKALVINCPNNPTGYQMSRNELCAIGEFARERNLTVVSDEVYAFLEYDENDRLPAACDLDGHAVSIGAMSKSFGLAGLRIAWVATRNRAMFERLAAFKDYTTICNSAPSELLATIALRNREELLVRNMSIIERNLAQLDGFFTAHSADFKWRAPKAGPVAFPSLRGPENAQQFSDRLLTGCGVLLLPGTIYDESYTHNFRIGFGRKNFTECLEKLWEVI